MGLLSGGGDAGASSSGYGGGGSSGTVVRVEDLMHRKAGSVRRHRQRIAVELSQQQGRERDPTQERAAMEMLRDVLPEEARYNLQMSLGGESGDRKDGEFQDLGQGEGSSVLDVGVEDAQLVGACAAPSAPAAALVESGVLLGVDVMDLSVLLDRQEEADSKEQRELAFSLAQLSLQALPLLNGGRSGKEKTRNFIIAGLTKVLHGVGSSIGAVFKNVSSLLSNRGSISQQFLFEKKHMDTLKCLIALKVDELEGKKNSAGEETRVDFGSASGSGSGSGGQMTVAIVYGAVIATLKRELRELVYRPPHVCTVRELLKTFMAVVSDVLATLDVEGQDRNVLGKECKDTMKGLIFTAATEEVEQSILFQGRALLFDLLLRSALDIEDHRARALRLTANAAATPGPLAEQINLNLRTVQEPMPFYKGLFDDPRELAVMRRNDEERNSSLLRKLQIHHVIPKKTDGIGNLHLKLVAGRGLAVKDTFSRSSDPFVKIYLGHQSVKSKVIKKTLNPVWNQEFNLTVYHVDEKLEIHLFDWNLIGRSDFMGWVYFSVGEILQRQESNNGFIDGEFPLLVKRGMSQNVKGSLHLQMHLELYGENSLVTELDKAIEMQKVLVRAVVRQQERERYHYIFGPEDFDILFDSYELIFNLPLFSRHVAAIEALGDISTADKRAALSTEVLNVSQSLVELIASDLGSHPEQMLKSMRLRLVQGLKDFALDFLLECVTDYHNYFTAVEGNMTIPTVLEIVQSVLNLPVVRDILSPDAGEYFDFCFEDLLRDGIKESTEDLFRVWLECAPVPEAPVASLSSPRGNRKSYQIVFALQKAMQFVAIDESIFNSYFSQFLALSELTAGTFYKVLAEEVLAIVPPDVTAESYDPVMVTLLELMRKAHNEWSDLISERMSFLPVDILFLPFLKQWAKHAAQCLNDCVSRIVEKDDWEPVSSAIHSTSPRYLHSLGVTNLVKFISCTLLKMIELCPAEQEIFNETRAVVIEGVVSSVQNYASKLQSFFSREVEENFQQRMREEQQNKGSTDQSLIVVMNEKLCVVLNNAEAALSELREQFFSLSDFSDLELDSILLPTEAAFRGASKAMCRVVAAKLSKFVNDSMHSILGVKSAAKKKKGFFSALASMFTRSKKAVAIPIQEALLPLTVYIEEQYSIMCSTCYDHAFCSFLSEMFATILKETEDVLLFPHKTPLLSEQVERGIEALQYLLNFLFEGEEDPLFVATRTAFEEKIQQLSQVLRSHFFQPDRELIRAFESSLAGSSTREILLRIMQSRTSSKDVRNHLAASRV